MAELEQNQIRQLAQGAHSQPALVTPVITQNGDLALEEEASLPLSHYVWLLKRNRWRMAAFVSIAMLGALILSSRITPIYESTAVVDIDREATSDAVNDGQNRTTPTNDSGQYMATQVVLIQSDAVLRPVVEEFHLDKETASGRGVFAFLRHAPPNAKAPIVLKHLRVQQHPETYLLGISYRSANPQLAADIANAIAHSYIEHTFHLRFSASQDLANFLETQLESLKAKMERSSAALAQFEKELNVIDPDEKTNILSGRLVQLNTQYTNAQTDRVAKEAAYQSVKAGSLEAAQVSEQGDSLKRLYEQLSDALQEFSDIRGRFGDDHPVYKRAAGRVEEIQHLIDQARNNTLQRAQVAFEQAVSREAMLKQAVADSKAEFDHLNATRFQYQALKEEAATDKKLYDELIMKIRGAGINATFQNTSIRIADIGRPANLPVFPNYPLNLILAFLLSAMTAVGITLISDKLDNSICDPEHVQRLLNTSVIGSLPTVKAWRRGFLRTPVGMADHLALASPAAGEKVDPNMTGYIEAMRTLRNSILLSSIGGPLRSILLTSAAPREGKSTTAVHMALSHAAQRRRTLVIDCDLRRPSLQSTFAIPKDSVGLADILRGEVSWRDSVIKLDSPAFLSIICAGTNTRDVADLIDSGLSKLLEEAMSEYDLVIVDAAPMLGFAEPLHLAKMVDGVVIVTLAGQTDRKAISAVLTTLRRVRSNVLGIVLNEITKEHTAGYYYYGYYGKYYSKYYSRSV